MHECAGRPSHKKGRKNLSGECMAKTATLEQSDEHYVCQTVPNMKTVVDEKSFNTGSSCSPLALGDVRLTAVDDAGIKTFKLPGHP